MTKWNGEGLPPVDLECLILCPVDKGQCKRLKGFVIAYDLSERLAWIKCKDGEYTFSGIVSIYTNPKAFLPLKTPEQEKRERQVKYALEWLAHDMPDSEKNEAIRCAVESLACSDRLRDPEEKQVKQLSWSVYQAIPVEFERGFKWLSDNGYIITGDE